MKSAFFVSIPLGAILSSALPTNPSRISSRQVSNVDSIVFPQPGTNETLPVPDLSKLVAITAGTGVQNYTCVDGQPQQSGPGAGAVAQLFDITSSATSQSECTAELAEAQLFVTNTPVASIKVPQGGSVGLKGEFPNIGIHYFDPEGTPTFDLGEKGFIQVKKLQAIPDQNAQTNVAWLQLGATEDSRNTLGEVYRLETLNGNAPVSCNDGDSFSQPYSAQYWFFQS